MECMAWHGMECYRTQSFFEGEKQGFQFDVSFDDTQKCYWHTIYSNTNRLPI